MTTSLGFVCPLFVPGNRPERFEKAAASGSDAIILDLEDAVAASKKDAARETLRADFTNLPVIVRINAAGTRWHETDIAAAEHIGAAAIMLPKAELDSAIGCAQVTSLPIIGLVETARGLAEARQIAAIPAVVRLAFGSIDYSVDLGSAHTHDAFLSARSELVLASRLASIVPPLDGVTTATDDENLIADDARYAASLGFGGKLCIHPRQVGPIKSGFLPDEKTIDWARRVLESSDGAVKIGGEMVDDPIRTRARRILGRLHSR
ncbi:HpcH/HpaI aldolase/citrate lyase family protein [Nitratireductor soli]|uniref:HpcH/HpaI aldolase/citrate lyase family protein n=1 Tax=Nitratireductor soli TaxID=1670619 RepID=UPI00065E3FDD|nr:CoA ester lyase [Nitratireductor soli]